MNRTFFFAESGLVLLFLLCGLIGGPASALDVGVVRALADLRISHPDLTRVVIWITQFGGAPLTIGSTTLAALWLIYRGARRSALVMALMVSGERLSVEVIKAMVGRPRPAFDAHPVFTSSTSFPSGHAANSMTALLALAIWLAPPRWRVPAVAAAVFLSLLVGSSRPFLGVHWPSDVIAGWAFGLAVILAAAKLFPPEPVRRDAITA